MGSALALRSSGLWIACLLLLTGCTGGASLDYSSGFLGELEAAPETTLPCRASVAARPDDFETILDVVALPTSVTYPNALQTSVREAADGTVYYFAKTGLWWQPDTSFQLIVPNELRSELVIGWGSPATPTHSLTGDCALDPEWMVLPGGFWVTEPMCAQVLVRVGSAEEQVEIGLGRPCDGQNPPVGPSDG